MLFRANSQNITVTTGNVVTVDSVTSGTFCLKVEATLSNSGDLYYDSDQGGVLAQGTDCS